MLAKAFYCHHKENQEMQGVALTHDLVQSPVVDEQGQMTGQFNTKALIGVAWFGGTEEGPYPALSYHDPAEVVFIDLVNDFDEEDEEDEGEDSVEG